MKKVIGYSFVAVMLLFVLNSNVNATNYDVNAVSNEVFKIQVNDAPKNSSLSLYDANGVLVFEESVIEAGYGKKLDLSAVPDGTYSMAVENAKTIETTLINKSNKGLEIVKNKEVFVKPSFVKGANNSLNVYFHNAKNAKIDVAVYDVQGNLIKKVSTTDSTIEKTLDFSNTPRGSYEVVLSSKDDDYTFSSEFENK